MSEDAASDTPVTALGTVRLARRGLGEFTTRELLRELELRGDLAMTAFPTTELGADGAVLSSLGRSVIKSSTPETLDATRGSIGK